MTQRQCFYLTFLTPLLLGRSLRWPTTKYLYCVSLYELHMNITWLSLLIQRKDLEDDTVELGEGGLTWQGECQTKIQTCSTATVPFQFDIQCKAV